MENIKFAFYTPYGGKYFVTNDNDIVKTNLPNSFYNTLPIPIPSGQWKFLGLKHRIKNEFISVNELTPEKIQSMKFKFKNGNPIYTIVDLDHGTTRIWGNSTVHGCAELSIINKN